MPIRVLTCALCLFAATSSGADQVRYPHNPLADGDRILVSNHGIVALTADGTQVVWRTLSGVLTFEPVVAGDHVYVGAADGLHALRRADGAHLWQVASAQFVYPPAAAGGRLFTGGRDGVLRALDGDSGEPLWQRRWGFWIYPPAVVADRVIFGGAAHRLSAVDRTTGADRWHTDLDGEPVYRPVAAGNGRIAVATFAGTVYMLAADGGDIIWAAHDGVASRSPLFAGKVVLSIGFDHMLRARDGDSGRLLWSRQFSQSVFATAAGDTFVIVAGSKMLALEAAGGRVAWTTSVAPGSAPVMVAGRAVAVPTTPSTHLEQVR